VRQSSAFYHGEGTAWIERNKDVLTGDDDPVMEAMILSKIKPNNVLEIGCANGWRMKLLEKKYKCAATGIEPAPMTSGNILRGMAHDLPIKQMRFDVVIYGWCLYLCDREDLFRIAMEGDRVLQDDGYLIINDFHSDDSYRRVYKHRPGLFSYKMDHAKLWLANPAYTLLRRYIHGSGEDQTSVTILKKNNVSGWPLHD
jgi:SAM-dependent methyltransferase